ncbi:hypothetical protein [Citrobacter koseri]|uniref:hypothetical protein n=1 Tax=Citrobacter koseri TaxID=545 RepID=UPI001902DB05|nr:hypothetical protein [Citrobacter koseri]MBJ9008881.1 hypothetical protein [Citrobacter koseri]
MTTITRELIAAYLNGEVKTLTNSEQKELARIALASLDAGSDSNNHPASGPLSDYRLHRIREILNKAAAQSDGGNIGYAMSDAVKAIDELLEMRKAEPVGYYRKGSDGFYFASPTEQRPGTIPLYAAPPAPVVDADDNFYSWFGREWEQYYQPNNYSLSAKKHLGAIAESAWFACRDAMLNGGKS